MSIHHLTKTATLFSFILLSTLAVNAQQTDSLLQKRIQAQQFVFIPLSASSNSATMPLDTKVYSLKVTLDSVIAVLPYFGNSNTPQHGRSDDDAILFTSTNFKYEAVPKKKGKWEISIQPNDTRGVRVFLTVFDNGEATMDVTSPRKQSMYFKGYVW